MRTERQLKPFRHSEMFFILSPNLFFFISCVSIVHRVSIPCVSRSGLFFLFPFCCLSQVVIQWELHKIKFPFSDLSKYISRWMLKAEYALLFLKSGCSVMIDSFQNHYTCLSYMPLITYHAMKTLLILEDSEFIYPLVVYVYSAYEVFHIFRSPTRIGSVSEPNLVPMTILQPRSNNDIALVTGGQPGHA